MDLFHVEHRRREVIGRKGRGPCAGRALRLCANPGGRCRGHLCRELYRADIVLPALAPSYVLHAPGGIQPPPGFLHIDCAGDFIPSRKGLIGFEVHAAGPYLVGEPVEGTAPEAALQVGPHQRPWAVAPAMPEYLRNPVYQAGDVERSDYVLVSPALPRPQDIEPRAGTCQYGVAPPASVVMPEAGAQSITAHRGNVEGGDDNIEAFQPVEPVCLLCGRRRGNTDAVQTERPLHLADDRA